MFAVVGDDGMAVRQPLGRLGGRDGRLADFVDDLLVLVDLLHGRAADDEQIAVGQELHVMAVVVAGFPEERAVFLDLDDLLVLMVGDDDVRLRPRDRAAKTAEVRPQQYADESRMFSLKKRTTEAQITENHTEKSKLR